MANSLTHDEHKDPGKVRALRFYFGFRVLVRAFRFYFGFRVLVRVLRFYFGFRGLGAYAA